jgi:putative tryptophan/tyrosine transport system substrate-binding protein
MKRRTFAAGLLGAVTLPFAVHAQRAGKSPVIGYIGANSEAIDRPRINAFMQRLSDLGWAEGRNIAVDARFTQGVVARAGEIAAEFVRRPVDLILTAGDAQVIAAKKATDAIPIVFAGRSRRQRPGREPAQSRR